MAAGLPDLVDCLRLAESGALLRRVYELSELPRVQDVLAEPRGTLLASFAFSKLAAGRSGVDVTISATAPLVCQRCLQRFELALSGGSEVEFSTIGESEGAASGRELFEIEAGQVSLRELAEEELLLALPVAPACSSPLTCGRAPQRATAGQASPPADEARRPFSALQDLLKKT